jgi:hypothetical protein
MSEMSGKSYEVVRCCYCSGPIPLAPPRSELSVSQAQPRRRSHAFILRCGVCSKESCYLSTEVQTLPGELSRDGFAPPRIPEADRRSAVLG